MIEMILLITVSLAAIYIIAFVAIVLKEMKPYIEGKYE